jgi:hypothetical protein
VLLLLLAGLQLQCSCWQILSITCNLRMLHVRSWSRTRDALLCEIQSLTTPASIAQHAGRTKRIPQLGNTKRVSV